MFPEFEFKTEVITTTSSSKSQRTTFKFDYSAGEFVVENGRLVEVTEKEAVKAWIEKVLKTEKNTYEVYKNNNLENYGINIKNLIQGKKLPTGFLCSELKREISEALEMHESIEKIVNFKVEQKKSLEITFDVILKGSEVLRMEVDYGQGKIG